MQNATYRLRAKAYIIVGFLLVSFTSFAQENSLHFDGSENVSIAHTPGLTLSSFTIEAWVKTSQVGAPFVAILRKPVAGNSNYFLAINNEKAHIRFDGSGGVGIDGTSSINDDKWHHIAGVFDNAGDLLSIYVDGVLENTLSSSQNPTTGTNPVTICEGGFVGEIDELRIWNTPRTQQEIVTDAYTTLSAGSGLVASYHFNDGVAGADNTGFTVLADISGNGNSGTLNSFTLTGPTSNWVASEAFAPKVVQATDASINGFTANWRAISNAQNITIDIDDDADFLSPFATNIAVSDPTSDFFFVAENLTSYVGQKLYYRLRFTDGGFTSPYSEVVEFMLTPGNALDFDLASDDYVDLGTQIREDFTGTSAITVEAWVYPTGAQALKTIIGNYNGGGGAQFLLRIDNGNPIFFVNTGSNVTVTSTVSVPLDTWSHIAGTYDGTTISVYVNGVRTDAAFTGNLANIGGNVTIGGTPGAPANEFMKGQLDEIRIWNTARSLSDIQGYLYSTINSNESGLVAYYRMDEGSADGSNTGISAPEVIDLTGNGNDGTMTGFAKTGTTSNWVTSAALQSTNAPVPPTDLIAYRASATQIALEWTDNSDGETGYMVERSSTEDFSSDIALVTNLPANSNSHLVTEDPARRYYRVIADNSNIPASASSFIEFATTEGHPGYAMNFDGTDDYVESPSPAIPTSGDFTIEVWVKHTGSTAVTREIVSQGIQAAGGFYIGTASDGTLRVGDSWPVTGVTYPTDGNWHAIAVSKSSTTTKLYIDGIEVANLGSAITNPEATAFRIGRQFAALDEYWLGEIDEVKIWNTEKTDFSDRFESLQGDEPNLVAYYTFDENAVNAIVFDRSINTNDGTPTGSPTYVQSGATGPTELVTQDINAQQINLQWVDNTENEDGFTIQRSTTGLFAGEEMSFPVAPNLTNYIDNSGITPEAEYFYRVRADLPGATPSAYTAVKYAIAKAAPGSAYDFDGIANFVDLGTNINSVLEGGTELALEAWIYPTAAADNQAIIGNYDDASTMQYLLRFQTNSVIFYLGNGPTTFATLVGTASTIPLSTWTHVAATYDGSNMRLYINGVLDVTSGLVTTSIQSISGISATIGGLSTNQYFQGSIDEVRIWNTTRTVQEVSDNKDRELDGNEQGLVAYYQLDEKTGTTVYDRSVNTNNGTNNGASIVAASAAMDTGVIPDVPTGLTARRISATQIELNWTDVPNEQSYNIIRANDATLIPNQVIGNVTADVTTFVDNVSTDQGYFYIIQSVNGVDGATSAAPEFATTADHPGTALSFNGVDGYTNAPESLGPLSTLTVSAWIFPRSFGGSNSWVYWRGNTTVDPTGGEIYITPAGLVGYGESDVTNQSVSASTPIPLNEWSHVAVVKTGGTAQIYINGVADGSSGTIDGTPPNGEISLGARVRLSPTDGFFDGLIDEVQVWDVAKTDFLDRFTQPDVQDANLVAYYPLDENAGTVTVDRSANENNGAINGGATFVNSTFADAPFITTWTATGGTITIPTRTPTFTYDYVVTYKNVTNPGIQEGSMSNQTADAVITGLEDGSTYSVEIIGSFPAIYFNNATNTAKIQSIDQWGDIQWSSMEQAFFGCSNLTYNATDAPDLSNVTSLRDMFNAAFAFNGDLSNWDLTNVNNISYMFFNGIGFNGDVTTWNVSNVTDMFGTFSTTPFNQDISGWSVSNVVIMQQMFANSNMFNQDLSSWDVSGVTNMRSMFDGSAAFNQSLASWDVAAVTNMIFMLNNSGISTSNYDATLVGWAGQTVQSGVSLGATNLTYTSTGAGARNTLETTYSWTISGDQSLVPVAPTNVIAYSSASDEVTLSWTDNAINETGFSIERATDYAFSSPESVTTVAANISSATFPVISAPRYFYRVTATNGFEDASSSSSVEFASTEAFPGYALSFDGVDDYILVSDHPSLEPVNYTFEVWANFANHPPLNEGLIFLQKGQLDTNPNGYVFGYFNDAGINKMYLSHADNIAVHQVFTPTYTVELNKWTHFAGVYDGTTLEVFVDGVSIGSTPVTADPFYTADEPNLKIGVSESTGGVLSGYFDGELDNLSIWDIAKTDFSDRFAPLTGNETNLIAYYPFDENTGTFLTDGSINTNDGMLLNGLTNTPAADGVTNGPIWQGSGVSQPSITYVAPIDFANNPPVLDGSPFSVVSQEATPQGLDFSKDGTRMYIIGSTGTEINQYDLSVPFDITTASFSNLFDVSLQQSNPFGMTFSNDGLKMYIVGQTEVNQYELSIPFDATTASFNAVTNNPLSIVSQQPTPTGITFSNDGLRMFISGKDGALGEINQYDLTVSFDITSATFTGGANNPLDVAAEANSPEDLKFSVDGSKMFIIGANSREVNQYDLSVPFDVTTATFTSTASNPFDVSVEETAPTGLAFSDNQLKMFLVGAVNDEVYQYSFSNNVFKEAAANDGSVEGSLIVSLENETFVDPATVESNLVITNLPSGLTPSVVLSLGNTVATITLTGNAIIHESANSISDLQVTFLNGAFTGNDASIVNNSLNVNTGFGIGFDDPLPPSITSFTPTSGDVGTVVTISGTEFNSTFANNSVYFGAIKVAPSAGNVASLTVTVPAGATSVAPILVQDNVTGRMASSLETIVGTNARQFNITNVTPYVPNYAAKVDYFTGSVQSPRDIVTGDFNGDDIADLATINSQFGEISVAIGVGDGTFGTPTNYTITSASNTFNMELGDFNGDGFLDIVSIGFNPSPALHIMIGDGLGAFSSTSSFPVNASPGELSVADFNGDGLLDVVVGYVAASTDVSVLIGTGTGSFETAVDYTVGTGPHSVKTGDFNNDGLADIGALNIGTNDLSILINDGAGSFLSATSYSAGGSNTLGNIVVGDYNEDGNLDIIASRAFNMEIFTGAGDGSFINSDFTFPDSYQPRYFEAGDYNGDGFLDIGSTSVSGTELRIYTGDGAFSFIHSATVTTDDEAERMVHADFNGDGRIDLAAAAGGTAENINVFLNVIPVNILDAIYSDTDLDGNIDQVRLVFDQNVDIIDAGAAGDGLDVIQLSYGPSVTLDAADYTVSAVNQLDINFLGDQIPGTSISGITLSYQHSGASEIRFEGGGAEIADLETPVVSTDNAAPVIISAATDDTDVNGEIGLIRATLSENIIDASSVFDATTTSVNGYSGFFTTTGSTPDDNLIEITFNESGSPDTGVTPNITLFTGNLSDGVVSLALDQTFTGTTDGANPVVLSIVRLNVDPAGAGAVNYQVTFSESVQNIVVGSFLVNETGLSGSNIASVSTSTGTQVDVTVDSYAGDGTLRLDYVSGVSDLAGNFASAFNAGEEYTIDQTAPSVVSITRLDANPTALGTVTFQVFFSEFVENISTGSFFVNETGLSGSNIASVSTSTGTQVDVTVDSYTGDGTLRLDYVSGISDQAGNFASAFNTGEEYTIDQTVPTITIDAPISGDDLVNASEAASVFISGTSDAEGETVTISIFDGVTTLFPTALVAGGIWNAVMDLSTLQDGTLNIDADVSDAVGNAAVTVSATVTLDQTAPVISINLPIAGDDNVNASEATAVTISGTSDENGETVTINFDDTVNPFVTETAFVSAGVWSLIADISSLNNGLITVTGDISDAAGNVTLATNAFVTMDQSIPTITLGANPSINQGILTADLTYSGTTNSPNQYTIDFDVTAEGEGFIDVPNTILPASPIALTVPGSAISQTYNGTITVINTTTENSSAPQAFTLTLTTDVTAPTLTSVSIGMDPSGNPNYANIGDIIDITFISDEDITNVTGTMFSGGNPVTASPPNVSGGPTNWNLRYGPTGTDTDGAFSFTIDFEDLAGNVGTQVTTVTDGSFVIFDQTAPVITSTSLSADNLTLTIDFDEEVFSDSDGLTDVVLNNFSFNQSGGTAVATAQSINVISGSQVEVTFTISGNPDGTESITIEPNVTVYNAAGLDMVLGQSNNSVTLNDINAPILSGLATSSISNSDANISISSDEAATLYYVITQSAVQPSAIQILNGQDENGVAAFAFNSFNEGSANTYNYNVGGLAASTTYHIYWIADDATGNQSNIVTLSFTTDAPPVDLTFTTNTVPAISLNAGTNDNLIYQVQMDVSGGTATMIGMFFTPNGTYAESDFIQFNYLESIGVDDFASATPIGSNGFFLGDGGIPDGNIGLYLTNAYTDETVYWYVTADIAAGATVGNTFGLDLPDTNANFGIDEDANQTDGGLAISQVFTIAASTPEIEITGLGTEIVSGDVTPDVADDTDFGSVDIVQTITKTYTINNLGTGDLILGTDAVSVSGDAAFAVSLQPDPVVSAGASTTFTIDFTASALGTFSAQIQVINDDADEGSYTFDVRGTGTQAAPSLSALSVNPSETDVSVDITVDVLSNLYYVISTSNRLPSDAQVIGGLDGDGILGENVGSFTGVTGMNSFSIGDPDFTAPALIPSTTYYIYWVAQNGGGSSPVLSETFTTLDQVNVSFTTETLTSGNLEVGTFDNLVYAFTLSSDTETAFEGVVIEFDNAVFDPAVDLEGLSPVTLWTNTTGNFEDPKSNLGSAGFGGDIDGRVLTGFEAALLTPGTMLPLGIPQYFFVSVDVAIGAAEGNQIQVIEGDIGNDVGLGDAVVTGTFDAGEFFNITIPIIEPDATFTTITVAGGSLVAGSTDNLIYKFSIAASGGNITKEGMSVAVGGDASSSDFAADGWKLYESVNVDVADPLTATEIGATNIGLIIPDTVGYAMTGDILDGDTHYYYLTVDVDAAATVGNSFNVVLHTPDPLEGFGLAEPKNKIDGGFVDGEFFTIESGDVTAPIVTVNALTTNVASPALTGTVDDASATISVDVEGGTYTATNNGDNTWTLPAGTITPDLAEGTYEVVVSATDGASNVGTDATTDELIVDTSAPVVTINALATNVVSPALSGTIDDVSATISVDVNGVGSFGATNNGDGTWTLASGTITPDLAEGTYEVVVSATDGASNVGTDATTDELIVDTAAPVVTINALATNVVSPALSGTIDDVSATISVDVNGVGSFGATNNGDGTWSLVAGTITPDITDGTYEVFLAATDAAGNIGTDVTSNELTIDTGSPIVTVDVFTTNVASPELTGTIDDINATISVEIDGNSYNAINVQDGNWTLTAGTITPDLTDGVYEILATATDGVGNMGVDATSNELTVDATIPTVTLSSSSSSPTNTSPIVVDIAFSEDVVGFEEGDITLSNGTLANFVTTDGSNYTVEVTPSADGVVTVDVAAGVAQDGVGNDNTVATQFSITSDQTSPSVTLSSTASDPTNTSPIVVDIVFSEDVVDFTVADITVSNGTLANFVATDGSNYTVEVTPSADGVVTVDVAAGVAQDGVGNDNTVSNTYSVEFDGGMPSVALSTALTSPTNAAVISVDITFSESVTGLTLGEITAVNGVVSNLTGLGAAYNVDITPTTDGDVTVDIASGVVEDGTGNTNSSAPQLTITSDRTAPVVTVDIYGTSVASPRVSGTVDDNTATLSVEIDGNNYTPTISDNTWELAAGVIAPDLTDGTYEVIATATDAAGNIGLDEEEDELTISQTVVALQASKRTSNSFQANWSKGESDVVGYELDVSIDDFTTFVTGYNAKSLPSTSTSDVVTGLDFGTTYSYRVRLVNSGGAQGNSNTRTPMTTTKTETEDDFAALQTIYNETGGTSWTDQKSWGVARLQDWADVTIDPSTQRVTGVDLSSNNLTGSFPLTVDLDQLSTLNISNNNLENLADLSELASLSDLNVSQNSLEFDDLEPVAGIATIDYSDQSSIEFNEASTAAIEVRYTSDYQLSVAMGGSANTYQWLRNGDLISNDGDFFINGEVNVILEIDYNNMGSFEVAVTNAQVPGLTITVDAQRVLAIADMTVEVRNSEDVLLPETLNGYLMETTRLAKGFDTLEIKRNTASTFVFPDVVLGNYLMAAESDPEKYIPTYFGEGDIVEWDKADTIEFRDDKAIQFQMTTIPPPLEGDGTLDILIEEDFGDDEGRVEARRRAARRKCGLRRKTGGGRVEADADGFELIAYGETDDNGEFQFGFLPSGTYRFFVEYPGIPLDDASFVEFEVGEAGISDTDFKLEAFATEDGIEVTIDVVLGVILDYFKDLAIYPNPADKGLFIKYRHLKSRDVTAELVDLTGATKWSKELTSGYNGDIEIDVRDMEEGVYILYFYDRGSREENVVSYRVIVQH